MSKKKRIIMSIILLFLIIVIVIVMIKMNNVKGPSKEASNQPTTTQMSTSDYLVEKEIGFYKGGYSLAMVYLSDMNDELEFSKNSNYKVDISKYGEDRGGIIYKIKVSSDVVGDYKIDIFNKTKNLKINTLSVIVTKVPVKKANETKDERYAREVYELNEKYGVKDMSEVPQDKMEAYTTEFEEIKARFN